MAERAAIGVVSILPMIIAEMMPKTIEITNEIKTISMTW